MMNSSFRAGALRPAALALAAMAACTAQAQEGTAPALKEVVVTATRTAQPLTDVVADVSIVQAILGAKIEVPTLDEPVTLEIPKGTQSGKILRIKGMGLPHLGSTQKGDLLVEVSVRIPSKVTKRQEELLREFDKLEESRPLNKVKDFFKKAMGD